MSEDVGEEYGVESRAVEKLGERGPEAEAVVVGGLGTGVAPKAWGEVAWGVHEEGVEEELFLLGVWSGLGIEGGVVGVVAFTSAVCDHWDRFTCCGAIRGVFVVVRRGIIF